MTTWYPPYFSDALRGVVVRWRGQAKSTATHMAVIRGAQYPAVFRSTLAAVHVHPVTNALLSTRVYIPTQSLSPPPQDTAARVHTHTIPRTGYCRAHGGGPRCTKSGCQKSDVGKGYCSYDICTSKFCVACADIKPSTGFCAAHGGGRRCQWSGCLSRARVAALCKQHHRLKIEGGSGQLVHPGDVSIHWL